MSIQIGNGRENSSSPETEYQQERRLATRSAATVTLSEADRRKAELLAFAQSIQVRDQSTFALAAQVRRDVRKVRDHYEELLRPGIREADALHTRLLDGLKSKTSELDKVDKLLKAQQDRYQEDEKRKELEEKRRLEAEMQRARERILADQFAQEVARAAAEKEAQSGSEDEGDDSASTADAAAAPSQLDSIMERMAQPAPSLPMISRPVRAEGATSRPIHTFTLLDPARIDPIWLLRMVIAEIRLKGECAWLDRQIRKEVEANRERAEEIVGKGSIKYEEKISTGVRR